jgi:hypothetical protein
MRKFSQLGLLLALFMMVSTAQASLLVEPLVGFNFNAKMGDEKGSGAAFGGRLGYQNIGLQLGVDYLRSTLDLTGINEDVKATEWAGFIGYKFPMFFRVYAAYIFSAEAEISNYKRNEGSGTKIGASFTGLPFVSLNLDYRRGTYEKLNGANDKVDFSALLFSVSLPFTL